MLLFLHQSHHQAPLEVWEQILSNHVVWADMLILDVACLELQHLNQRSKRSLKKEGLIRQQGPSCSNGRPEC